jgi:23S rRNA-/tRNA-specific pseudouridylate synthase
MTTSLTFLYTDPEIFAVYKPAALHSVRAGDSGGASVADQLLAWREDLSESSLNPGDAGLVHRLDFSTSGILLGAFSREMWEILRDLLQQGRITKEYIALVEGEFKGPREVTTFIGSPYRGGKKVRVYEQDPGSKARALEGTTIFTPISYLHQRDMSLVQVSASPARRHQVRVHAAYCGHPLVGDTLYGASTTLDGLTKTPRDFLLHASHIAFTHPRSGERIEICAAIEEEMAVAFG